MSLSPRTMVKWLLYPGTNLHARLRYLQLPAFLGSSNGGARRKVLDAGCGNGMLSYQSYLKGNDVIGISFKEAEVDGCRSLFNDHLGISKERMRFENGNLYDVDFADKAFDEVICTEVLEHLSDDLSVCRAFWRVLKPGGVLHITAPNAEHPYNAAFPLDTQEQGGHVRAGYTLQTFRALLEPIGFEIEHYLGLGGPVRQTFNRRIKEIQERFGAIAGLPLFLVALPCLLFESNTKEREHPYSIYIRAVKRNPAHGMH